MHSTARETSGNFIEGIKQSFSKSNKTGEQKGTACYIKASFFTYTIPEV